MKIISKFVALLVAVVAVASATPASAQATRTWVSGVGDDVNPCSRTAPCKTFAGAISKTAPGGEINCLDPAGFGAVTITRSLTIDCTGTLGGILASSTTGVIVNAANIHVVLRGLEINGGTPGLPGVNGIRFLQGSSLTIEDSTVYNFPGSGVNGFGLAVNPTSGDMRVYVRNSVFRNNGGAANGGGIGIVPPSGAATIRVTLENVQLFNNLNSGLTVNTTGSTATVTLSLEGGTMAGNSGVGLALSAPAGSTVGVMVNNSAIVNNATGVVANGATVTGRVDNTTITGNTTGLLIVGGATLNSYGHNRLDGNPTVGAPNNGAFTGAIIPTK